MRSSSIARARAALGAIDVCVRSISAIWNPMVYTGFSAVIGSWKITAMSSPRRCRSTRSGAPTTCRSPSLIEPRTCELLGSKPIRLIATVDLPEPDSPTIASTSPAASVKEAPSTAGYQVPSTQKSIERSSTRSTGPPGCRVVAAAAIVELMRGTVLSSSAAMP